MDLSYPAETEEFRGSVRDFLSKHVPDGWQGTGALPVDQQAEFLAEWRRRLHENGLLAVSWPAEYGGAGRTAVEQLVIAEEFTAAGVPQGGPNDNFGIQMLGSTLLRFGTEEQRRYYLPRVLSQEHVWCQGFSEPEAGSDLAGIRTRARLDGDRWIIDGQKTWTSYAHLSTHMFLLCRTEPGSVRNKGLSLLVVPLDQPGIQVRPLRTMTGDVDFNEVFLTGAECSADDVIGDVGAGWTVAMSLLGFERGEAAATLPMKFRADLDRLVELARRTGRSADPTIRLRLALCAEGVEQMRCMGLRAVSRWLAGHDIGAESSVHKLYWSEWLQRTTELAVDILGLEATTPVGDGLQGMSFPAAEAGTPNTSGAWVDYFLRARAATIYAGSSEIQRTIIGERLLGLPKEPR